MFDDNTPQQVTLSFNPDHEQRRVTITVNRKKTLLPTAASDNLFDWLDLNRVQVGMDLRGGRTCRTDIPRSFLMLIGLR